MCFYAIYNIVNIGFGNKTFTVFVDCGNGYRMFFYMPIIDVISSRLMGMVF